MRLHLRLTGNSEPVPFDHLHRLTGAVHKWLGAANVEHDGPSLYSFGWLGGGKPSPNDGLHFPRGATWFLSFHDVDATRRVLDGILRDPEVTHGMRVLEVREQAPPHFGGDYRFKVAGPVVARAPREGGGRDYLLWDDSRAPAALTRVLRNKLEAAGFAREHLNVGVEFDDTYSGARSKLITLKGVKHRGSMCPVVVSGTPEAVSFAWEVGIGELTGCGCGGVW